MNGLITNVGLIVWVYVVVRGFQQVRMANTVLASVQGWCLTLLSTGFMYDLVLNSENLAKKSGGIGMVEVAKVATAAIFFGLIFEELAKAKRRSDGNAEPTA